MSFVVVCQVRKHHLGFFNQQSRVTVKTSHDHHRARRKMASQTKRTPSDAMRRVLSIKSDGVFSNLIVVRSTHNYACADCLPDCRLSPRGVAPSLVILLIPCYVHVFTGTSICRELTHLSKRLLVSRTVVTVIRVSYQSTAVLCSPRVTQQLLWRRSCREPFL
jgi:hypothetical protein